MTHIEQSIGSLVTTADGSLSLIHPDHGECYHSHLGALSEAENLYMAHSGIRETFRNKTFVAVLDVGLGLAYNSCKTIEAWWQSPGHCDLSILSLEINRDLVNSLKNLSAPWLKDWPCQWKSWCQTLNTKDLSEQCQEISHPNGPASCRWQVDIQDASQLQEFDLCFDFIWQDAFSPKKNPSLWTKDWFELLRNYAHADATLLTYSVARVVKDNLSQAGWQWQLLKGAGPKSKWMKAKNANTI